MTILLTQATRIAGTPVAAGTQQTLEASLEADLVSRKMATYISDPAAKLSDVPVTSRKSLTGGSIFSGIAAGVAIDQSGAAANTPADTLESVLASVTIPGGWMGKNGRIEVFGVWSYNNSAGTKTMRVKFGASTVLQLLATTTQSSRTTTNIINRNSESAQFSGAVTGATGYQDFLGSASPNLAYSEDTANDVVVQITGQKSVGADTLVLECFSVVLYPHG